MSRIYSNNRKKGNFVYKPFAQLLRTSVRVQFATPYFTKADLLYNAAKDGKKIQLLIGLNEVTCPVALEKIYGMHDVVIRYLTNKFHPKIYIFDHSALLGSANLTEGGLRTNREAVIKLNSKSDPEALEEIRSLFKELWETGEVLTKEKLDVFKRDYYQLRNNMPSAEKSIEAAFEKIQPKRIRSRAYFKNLERKVRECYLPAFCEVKDIIDKHKFRHPDLEGVEIEYVTNRFLNYVKLTYARGKNTWNSSLLPQDERYKLITNYAQEWSLAANSKVPEGYIAWLGNVRQTFESEETIMATDRNQIMNALMSVHSFLGQRRFVEGGEENLPQEFWLQNNNNLEFVQSSLAYLLHGYGDFVVRLYYILRTDRKINLFGPSSALELFGTVNPNDCPPMNGRMIQALRFLGFDMKGT